MNLFQFAPSPQADMPSRLHDVAKSIAQRLRGGGSITRQAIKKFMVEAFGADDADGAWSMRDAYDALEAAQVMLLADAECALLRSNSAPDVCARLRAVIMTAVTTALGLFPLLFATGTGGEVQRPLATVVVGGLVTATILTLLVLPALYHWFADKPADMSESH